MDSTAISPLDNAAYWAIQEAQREGFLRQSFGVIGAATAHLWDALARSEVSTLHCIHEGAAMNAGLGYSVATGCPPLVHATSGPGLTNCITGCASAAASHLGLVLWAGEVERNLQGRGALQDGSPKGMRLLDVAYPIVRACWNVDSPEKLGEILCEAFWLAGHGAPAPVLLSVPFDVASAKIARPNPVPRVFEAPRRMQKQTLDELVAMIYRSKRPVCIAGSGCRSSQAKPLLKQFAERAQIPIVTSPQAKGVFPETHPLSVGCIGYGGHDHAQRLLEKADFILVLACSLGETSTQRFRQQYDSEVRIVRIDLDERKFQNRQLHDQCWVASVETVLEDLLDVLLSKSCSDTPPRSTPKWQTTTPPSFIKDSSTPPLLAPLAASQALLSLQPKLPSDTFHVLDIGEHTQFATHYLRMRPGEECWVENGFGSLGSGFAAGIGVKLAQPHRSVVIHCGDQGFLVAGNELSNCVREGIACLFCIYDDGKMAIVEDGMHRLGLRFPQLPTGHIDLVAWAQSMGARAIKISNLEDIEHLPIDVLEPKIPTVLILKISEHHRISSYGRVGQFVQSLQISNAQQGNLT